MPKAWLRASSANHGSHSRLVLSQKPVPRTLSPRLPSAGPSSRDLRPGALADPGEAVMKQQCHRTSSPPVRKQTVRSCRRPTTWGALL